MKLRITISAEFGRPKYNTWTAEDLADMKLYSFKQLADTLIEYGIDNQKMLVEEVVE